MKTRMVNIQLETSRKKMLRNNTSKFLFFAWTLDRLVQYQNYYGAERINIGYIDKSIYKTNLIKESEKPEDSVNCWLQEMILIGLIKIEVDRERNLELVYITPKGVEAYKSQTYHVISANLLEADETRKLSRIAVGIAILSIIITIVLAIIPQ